MLTRLVLIASLIVAYMPMAHATEKDVSEAVIIKLPEDYANTPWAKLNIPVGTKLFKHKTDSGKELHNLEFVGGVSMSELEDGGTLSIDDSKGGAVMCLWEIHAMMKNTMDKCYPEETELRQNFDLVIEKLEKFIIANSLSPITKIDLENDLQKKRDNLPKECKGKVDKTTKKYMAEKSKLIEQLKHIDESLATPRPPVINPCL